MTTRHRTSHILHLLLSTCLTLCALGGLSPKGSIQLVFARSATTYYVSPSGSDNNDGLTVNHPFAHIKDCTIVMHPGDTCLVRKGTYHETVTVRVPNTTFRPYTTETPVIDGADPVSSPWIRVSGATYYKTRTRSRLPGPLLDNQLFVDEVMVPVVRWPYPGTNLMNPYEATATASTTRTLICDTALVRTAANHFWRGALLHVASGLNWWANTVRVVDSGVGGVHCGPGVGWVTFNRVPLALGVGESDHWLFDVVPLNTYDLTPATATQALMLLQSMPRSANAWFFDGQQLYLRLANGDVPTQHLIEMKQRVNALDIEADHVSITGPNGNSFSVRGAAILVNGNGDFVDGIYGLYMTHFVDFGRLSGSDIHGTVGGVTLNGAHDTLTESFIADNAGNAVALTGDHGTIQNNMIENVDYSGSGGSGIEGEFATPGTGSASYATIDHNTLDNMGAAGIVLFAMTNTVTYNDISRTGAFVNDVNGGLLSDGNYTGNPGGGRSTFAYNWVHDNLDSPAKARNFCVLPPDSCATAGNGIYLDISAAPWLIHHNVVWNQGYADLVLNGNGSPPGNQNNQVYNNTLADTTVATALAASFYDANMTGTVIQNNIFMKPPITTTYITPPILTPNLEGDQSGQNPLFVDATHHDYHLFSASPALGSGVLIEGIADVKDQGAYPASGANAHWGPPGCTYDGCHI